MYVSYFVSLHPFAFHHTAPPNPSSRPCPSPQFHLTLSAFHACSLLFTPCPLAPYLQNRNEGVEWRQRWTCRRVERGMEEKKFAEKWKGKGKSTSSGSSKKRNKYASFVSIFGDLLHPSLHPSLHPRSALAPPTEKAMKSMHFYIAWEAKCLSPPYALYLHCCFWIMS